MQIKQLFTAGILSLMILVSCSKKNDDIVNADVTIEGTWIGKHSFLSEPLNNHYSFQIKAGGILERLDANGQKIGEGTWAFYNAEAGITGTYTLTGGGTYSIIATFDKVNGKLDGTWGNGTNDYNGGYWFMNKIQ